MATITTRMARYIGNIHGGPTCAGGAEQPQYKEAASQTYKKGHLVMSSSGKIAAATTHASNQVAAAGGLGFALEAATGTTDTKAPIRKIKAGDVFACNMFTSGAATATLITHLHTNVGFLYPAVGQLVVDDALTDTTKLYGHVIGFLNDDTLGDTGGRVLVLVPDQVALRG